MQHNFFPTVMTISGTIMALHYTTFIDTMKSCPITLAYGSSGTGKTTALHCGLALVGADDIQFYQEPTTAMVQKLCSETNIPLGVDDPDTKGAFSKVVVDVYGGGEEGHNLEVGDTSNLNSCDIIQFPNCGPTEVCRQA